MILYVLQISYGHCKPDREAEVYIFSNYQNLLSEYRVKLEYFRNQDTESVVCHHTDPKMDESTGEVYGRFTVVTGNGTVVRAKAYDYDVLDEDE